VAAQTDVPAEATLAVPGVLCVSPLASDRSVVQLGPAAGWLLSRGIARWQREISFVARKDMTADLARAVHAVLPHEQIAPKKFPMTTKAVENSPFLPLRSKLLELVKERGVRVHTVGVDRVTASFYYFAEGGSADPVRIEGNLVEMLSPSLEPSTTNKEIEALREDLIDRLLTKFSGGGVSELAVELADALPRLSTDGRGLVGTNLEIFEVQARTLSGQSARFESRAQEIVRALDAAKRDGKDSATVPLFGEAHEEVLPALKVRIGGDTVELPPRRRWIVKGALREQPAKASGEEPVSATASKVATGPLRAPRPSDVPPAMKPKEAKEEKEKEEEQEEPKERTEAKATEAAKPKEADAAEATAEEQDEEIPVAEPRPTRPPARPADESPRAALSGATLFWRAFAVLLIVAALVNVWHAALAK
jgi:hypothetical protein